MGKKTNSNEKALSEKRKSKKEIDVESEVKKLTEEYENYKNNEKSKEKEYELWKQRGGTEIDSKIKNLKTSMNDDKLHFRELNIADLSELEELEEEKEKIKSKIKKELKD